MKNILLSTAVVSLLAACGGSGASDTITPDDAHIDLSKEKKGSVVINTPNGRLHGYNQYASFYGVWVDDNKAKRELRYRGVKTSRKVARRFTTATPYAGIPSRIRFCLMAKVP